DRLRLLDNGGRGAKKNRGGEGEIRGSLGRRVDVSPPPLGWVCPRWTPPTHLLGGPQWPGGAWGPPGPEWRAVEPTPPSPAGSPARESVDRVVPQTTRLGGRQAHPRTGAEKKAWIRVLDPSGVRNHGPREMGVQPQMRDLGLLALSRPIRDDPEPYPLLVQ